MRKVRYGVFVDFMPPVYDPYGLIGEHIYVRRAERESLKTAGYEYYIIDNGEIKTVADANFFEKIRARFLFLFNSRKKKVVGVRDELKVSPYSDPDPQLGVKLADDGKKVVDESYYRMHEKRVMNDSQKSRGEKIEESEKIRATFEEAKRIFEEEIPEEENKKIHR